MLLLQLRSTNVYVLLQLRSTSVCVVAANIHNCVCCCCSQDPQVSVSLLQLRSTSVLLLQPRSTSTCWRSRAWCSRGRASATTTSSSCCWPDSLQTNSPSTASTPTPNTGSVITMDTCINTTHTHMHARTHAHATHVSCVVAQLHIHTLCVLLLQPRSTQCLCR